MNWIIPSILFILLGTECISFTNSAEISIPSPPPLKIDRHLRRALLRALEKLDEEDPSTSESRENVGDELLDVSTDKADTNQDKTEEDSKFSDKNPITVKDEEEEVKAQVFIHSVNSAVDPSEAKTNTNDVTPRSKDNHEKIGTENLKIKLSPRPNEVSVTPAITVSHRGVDNTIKGLIELTASTQKPVSTTTSKALPSPVPTSITPTEEDVSKVKVEDVQFIHAPLVAAFTVQQDNLGVPHKVIPLFGTKTNQQKANLVKVEPTPTQTTLFTNPLLTLEEKQKLLEKQIRELQEQKIREEEKLRQQIRAQEEFRKQLLFQQLPAQQSAIKFNNDINVEEIKQKLQIPTVQQLPLQQTNVNFTQTSVQIDKAQSLPPQHINPTIGRPQHLVQSPVQSQNNFQIQHSLSFQPNRFGGIIPGQNLPFGELHFAGQQPPIKEAVNFQQSQQVPFFSPPQGNIFQQQLPLQFPQQNFNNDNNLIQQDFRVQLPPIPNGPHHPTRVFRHESQTGNFGINNDFNRNRFNQFNSIQNHFPTHQRPNVETIRSNSINYRPFEQRNFFGGHNQFDARLKHLFHQSGFGQGRSQEDFNIVSKVLALDHTR